MKSMGILRKRRNVMNGNDGWGKPNTVRPLVTWLWIDTAELKVKKEKKTLRNCCASPILVAVPASCCSEIA